MDFSIIIPTLNEANYIEETVAKIRTCQSGTLALEIIIIDAGSKDDTVELIDEKVDVVYRDSTLTGAKYKSLNKGAQMAKGEILLFLDADTLLPSNFDLLIKNALLKKGVVGGAFEFQIDGNGIIYRLIEWINRVRYRVDRRYFGDQAMFCSKKSFEQVGGYPKEPIMEAAYFCQT
ncbi:glycosyltransferase, partial [Reichenbachiella sp.]